MRARLWLGCLLCLLFAAGTWFLWHRGNVRDGSPSRPHAAVAPAVRPQLSSVVLSHGVINTNPTQISLAEWNTNRFAGRLSNTTKSIGQLMGDNHAILLANALMDTSLPLNFVFPKNLQPQGDPGAYIVQARGPIDNAFRAMLAQAGATMVAYIPNDAYLVRASASVAGLLGANPQTQAVVPYEPYYKIQSSLLYPAVNQNQLADGQVLKLGLFADNAPATVQQIKKLGGQVMGDDQSPFGPVVLVIPPKNWTALATLPGVQIVEPFRSRAVANDLSRAANGVAADSLTATNYLGLTGAGVTVEVNDTGIDAQHPDLMAGGNYGKLLGVIGDAPQSLVDTNGHGTHVAGIIAGDGNASQTVTNAPGSTFTNTANAGAPFINGPSGVPHGGAGQFRGMAPGATLYSVGGIFGGADTNVISDYYFQTVPALTNALISNNSWVYEGDSVYDLAAASYDAATRDALPFVTGSQPVLFVFAAGNAGDGSDSEDLGGGIADSIESPATAKDVITVGAIQEDRNISVTVTNADGSPNTSWADETSTGYRVAGFSSRGNVGVGIEGPVGRYKPDVCAPGTFTLSTRSEQWDIGTYFYQNPTNDQSKYYTGFTVQPGSIVSRPFPTIPTNTVECQIWTFPNANSPFSFADLPLRITLFGSPTAYGPFTNYPVLIPGTTGTPTLAQIFGSQSFFGFNFVISNNTPNQVIFDLQTDVITTNGSGNYFLALSNLDNSIGTPNSASTGPGPYYRYETGTSMAAADVSGVLALMQQFYFNAYNVLPSPAMLKAMIINGGQATGLYNFLVQNTLNYEGWGLVNLPDSLPPGITNQPNTACSAYIQDQSPTYALATGGSQTYRVTFATNGAPLRVTLAWTDPPGDPAAAIKLVNNLVLVVTNLSNPTNPIVYYGNDIGSSTVNSPHATNTPPVFDSINNVQNVYLQPGAGTNFSVTILGFRVNVNAVTAQTNNVVQDYALVISTGNSGLANVMTVSPPATVSNPTGDQQIIFPAQTSTGSGPTATSFGELLNQFAGANSPLLGTNTVVFTPAAPEGFGSNNWQVTVGQTNQWQFYVVTNPQPNVLSNAAFITFNPNAPDPDTLATPRMGVFGGTVGNATREADIDMYVTTDPTITNLNPAAISNAVVGTQIGGPPGVPFAGASLGRGTTEFVVDTNSWSRAAPNVYYIGIKSEDQQSAEYAFIAVFSAAPFSTMKNGVQTVTGVPVPMNIPDGSPAVPGKSYVFGLAIYPETVGTVTVANEITHQNFGDLIGTLTLNGGHADVLNNHDSLGNPPGPYFLTYDDSAGGGIPGSRPSDGPGSLIGYFGQQALGVWMLNEVDDSLTQTGAVNSFTTTIYPDQKPTIGLVTNFVPGGSWVYGSIDVPPGATNLTIYATNYTAVVNPGQRANPPVELFVQYGTEPTTNSFIPPMVVLNPNGVFSLGPPLASGRYFYGLFNPNPSSATQEIHLLAIISGPAAQQTIYTSGDTPIPILDDAVTTDSIIVPDNQTIASLEVALRVQHPRISDLVFHLIGPDGTRDLLVENRGGNTADMGATLSSSNSMLEAQTFSGGATPPTTNIINPGATSGTLPISYNFYTLPDELAVYYTNGAQIFDSGMVSGSGLFNIPYTSSPLVIVMNPFGNNGGPGDAWTYTVSALQTNAYTYLVLTEDTNKTTTPIKFAVPPFAASAASTNTVAASSFDSATPGDYTTTFNDGTNVWTVSSNQVSVVNDLADADSGSNFLALANGTVSTVLPTVPGKTYVLSFRYRGPGIVSMWRGESNASDSVDGNSGTWNGTTAYGQGKVGSAFSFNGASDVGLSNGASSLNPPGSFSMEGWIYPLVDQNGKILAKWGDQGSYNNQRSYTLEAELGHSLAFSLSDAFNQGNPAFQGFVVPNVLTPGAWNHVAGTYDITTGTRRLYVNGVPVGTNVNAAVAAYASITPVTIGGWLRAPGTTQDYFDGSIDELGFYGRSLSASEVRAIYTDGANGDFNPSQSIPTALAEAQVSVGGGTPAMFYGNNTTWQTKTVVFTATQTQTPLTLAGVEPGMLLDSFSLAQSGGDLYYLPEQPLDVFDGDNAQGAWTLEIQDDRAGATNPTPQLLSWQLRFLYTTTSTNPNGIPSGPLTNVIPAGSWEYIPVNVPVNADTATNILVSATGPLDVWFNPNNNPTGVTPPDYLLFGNSTAGSSTLSTFSVPTNIVPGGVYYIGLHNTGVIPVTNVFEVNFHYFQIIPGGPGVPITNVVAGTINGDGVNYYSFTVPPNADYATNLLVSSTTPVNVWFNQTKPPVCLSPPDSLLISNATNGVFVLSAGSTPPLVPGATYNVAIQNTNSPNATNVFEVNFHIYTQLTNGVPTTNSVPPNSFAYYTVTVPTNADYATNLLLFATTNLNVWFNLYGPPIGASPADSLLISNATSGVSTLSATSAPPLVPGATYYLGVQNTNAVTVTFGLEVDFHFVSAISIPITGPTITATNVNGTNGFLLQWTGPTNDQYAIQWKTNLAPVIPWITVSNPVINVTYTPTNGDYSWFDDGSLTGGWPPQKFYRVVGNLLSGPITNSTPVTNIVVSGTITPLTVTVPTNAIAATNVLVSATGPVDVWFNQNTQPVGNTGAGDVLMIPTNTSGTFVLTGSSVPPLVPGANYYLGIQSLGTSNVVFSFQVNFAYGSPPTNPPSISSITVTNVGGTNEILLQWTEPTNYQFQVEWATNLAPAIAWHTISNVVVTWSGVGSPTNAAYGLFRFLDDGSLTGGWGPLKFYRLVEYPYSTPIPQSLTIVNTAMIGNAVQFQWVAPTNYQYSVLWTTNLGLPLANWSVLANPVLGLSNGVYTFMDTNQTGPADSPKFFRLLEH